MAFRCGYIPNGRTRKDEFGNHQRYVRPRVNSLYKDQSAPPTVSYIGTLHRYITHDGHYFSWRFLDDLSVVFRGLFHLLLLPLRLITLRHSFPINPAVS